MQTTSGFWLHGSCIRRGRSSDKSFLSRKGPIGAMISSSYLCIPLGENTSLNTSGLSYDIGRASWASKIGRGKVMGSPKSVVSSVSLSLACWDPLSACGKGSGWPPEVEEKVSQEDENTRSGPRASHGAIPVAGNVRLCRKTSEVTKDPRPLNCPGDFGTCATATRKQIWAPWSLL